KDDVEHGGGVGGLAIPPSRFKVDLFGGMDGGFVQTVSEAAYDANHTQLAGGLKHHLEQDLAFQPELARFVGVDRIRFGNDLRRCDAGWCGCGRLADLCRCRLGIAETAFAYCTSAPGSVGFCYTVSEASARDYAACAARTAVPVPVALARGKIE